MGNQFSNRTLVVASLVVIASSVALNVIQPKAHWRPSSRHERPAMPRATRPADAFEVQIMAPDLLASKATTTVSFRILNRGEIVTAFARPVEQAVQVAVARRNSYAVQPLEALFSTTTGSFTVPVSLPEAGIYRFVIDFLPKSGTPVRRFGDVEVGGHSSVAPTDWPSYTSPDGTYSLRYPKGWVVKDNDPLNIPGVRVGPEPRAVDGPWGIFIYEASERSAEAVIRSIGQQFSDRVEKRGAIVVDGVPATRVVVTTPSIPTWFAESVIVVHLGKVYHLTNGAVQNSDFRTFYESLTFEG